MKKILYKFLLVLLLTLLFCGCGKEETSSGKDTSEEDIREEDISGEDDLEEEDLEDEDSQNESEVTNQDREYTLGSITITFPENWEGKYLLEEQDNGFTVYQKSSYDVQMGAGFLFWIGESDTPEYNLPAGRILAYTEDKAYMIIYPSDVPYIYDDDAIAREYEEMALGMESIERSLQIAEEGVHYNAHEYILPMSEYHELTEMDVIDLSGKSLILARNEILARHGYHFDNEYLQAYFERCSWYEDRGSSYSDGELTAIDRANLNLLQTVEVEKRSEFPLELNVNESYDIDLDQDGTTETVRYLVSYDEWDYAEGTIEVNGVAYPLQDLGIYPDNLYEEHFYITDINSFCPGLEIAVIDYGPSDDPITSFMVYQNGSLNYLGGVPGYPVFSWVEFEDGTVFGRIRLDLLETCVGYGRWWYNVTDGSLEFQATGYYELDPWYAHRLLMDLPVYLSRNEGADRITIPAGSMVYLMASDGEHWTKVRSEDGTEGWIYSNGNVIQGINQSADLVMEGLLFYD